MMDTPRQRAATGARVVSFPDTRAERATVDEGRERSCSTWSSTTCPRRIDVDANMRLVFCNQGFIGMYGLSSDIAATVARCVTRQSRRGDRGAHGRPDEYIEKLVGDLQGQDLQRIIKGKDGRIVSIVNKPLMGRVAFHRTRISPSASAPGADRPHGRAMTR